MDNGSMDMSESGLDIIDDIPWGTHFYQFYQTKEDLINILVPYFKAGLENDEFCMWVTSEPLSVEEARAALGKAVPGINTYLKNGQLEILPHTEGYNIKNDFDFTRVLNAWLDKLNEAQDNGFDGLRLSGDTFWLGRGGWDNFTSYEEEMDKSISRYKMIVLCTYSLDKCDVDEIIDVLNTHEIALIKKESEWTLFESSKQKETKKALDKSLKMEAFLGELLEYSAQPFCVNHSDGRIVLTNQAFEELTGYTKEELKNINWLETLIPFESWTIEQKKLEELERTKKPVRYEKEYIRKDGTRIPIEILVHLIMNEDGKPKYYYSFITDITKRVETAKHKDDRLKKSVNLQKNLEFQMKN
jgi:PAS domain S-box-containing protein